MTNGRAIRWGFAAAGLLAVAGAGTAVLLNIPFAAALRGGEGALGKGWRRHRDPMGFSVDLPRNWTLRGEAGSGRVEMAGPGERLVVWPLFMGVDPGRNAGVLAGRLARRLWPEARWGAPEAAGAGACRVLGSAGEARGACILTWTPTPKGTAAFAYLVQAQGPAEEAPFARILASFRLEGPRMEGAASPPAPPRPHYRTWTDPREGAFSLALPEGWPAEGGAQRPSTLLVQAEVRAQSPEGEIALLLGDAFPVFVEPNPLLAFAGIREGGTYVDATGYAQPVAPYHPGASYALRGILPRRASGFQILHQADRPDLARRLATLGLNRFDAGEVTYRFHRRGRAYKGWILCITERVAAPQHVNWHVWRACLAEAPEGRFDEAAAALRHAVSTFRVDPVWAQSQARLTAAQTRIIAEMGEATSRTILEAGEFRSRTLDEIDRRGANARRGVDEVADPLTGRKMTVSSGSSYYWVDDRGTVVGTDTATQPTVDFRALTRLP